MDECLKYYSQAWGKLFDFKGRARRKEFWSFAFFNIFVLGFLSFGVFYLVNKMPTGYMYFGHVSNILNILIFGVSLSISIRRLHDIGRSGWWLFISFVPIVGVFILLYFYICSGEKMDNEYGENPKA